MASRIFIDAGYAAERLGGITPSDPLLESAMESACQTIERHLERKILEASYTAVHSGYLALPDAGYTVDNSHRLYLADPDTGFALHPVSTITSLKEDGVTLTVVSVPTTAQPYATSAGAVLFERSGILMRATIASSGYGWMPKQWSSGYGNIRVSCTAGFAVANVPADLKEVARELTWLFYKEGSRSGMESMSESGSAIQFIRTLPNLMQRTLNLYSRRNYPRTLAA